MQGAPTENPRRRFEGEGEREQPSQALRARTQQTRPAARLARPQVLPARSNFTWSDFLRVISDHDQPVS